MHNEQENQDLLIENTYLRNSIIELSKMVQILTDTTQNMVKVNLLAMEKIRDLQKQILKQSHKNYSDADIKLEKAQEKILELQKTVLEINLNKEI
jgi:hypothetical protein